MNSRLRGRAQWIIAVLMFCTLIISGAEPKRIRLRNETITTPYVPASERQLKSSNYDQPVTGLFLIQFTGAVQAEWRKHLSDLNVDLVRFVPEDAFIAHFRGAKLSAIRRLSFVHWVGEYKDFYKVHGSLTDMKRGRKNSLQPLAVSVLLSPKVSPEEALKIRNILGKQPQESKSRFGSIFRGRLAPDQLDSLVKSDAVLWVEPSPQMKLLDETSSKIVAGGAVDLAGNGVETNKLAGFLNLGPAIGRTNLHATVAQQLGFDGRGVAVAVADSGLHNGNAETMHPDLAGRVAAFFYYGNLKNASDEHGHGTHAAGIIAGNGATGEMDDYGSLYGLGVAPRANIVVQRLFDGVGGYEAPPTFETMTRDAVRAGAYIGSNSWGDDTQGRYDLSAAEFDALVRDADAQAPGDQPYILEFSAGNAGPGHQTVGSPAVAKNVIATGASQNNRFDFMIYADGQETMADFSSRGPAEDGRIKPDVVAPGTWIASLFSESATDDNAWSAISSKYMYLGGTSQAGPHVSGAAAVFVQFYRDTHDGRTPSPALVKAALINSATDMDNEIGTDPVPNMDEGWGRIDLTQIIGSERNSEYEDQSKLLATGEIYEKKVIIASANEPLRITLVYTDVPGLPSAIPALVNNIDLEVIGPDGSKYHGNQFDRGESVPGARAFDNINNVEAVHLRNPRPGEYVVRIHARNIVEDARRDTERVDQDFALVASGDIPLPGEGVVLFDRDAYTASSQVQLKLIDFDLAGQSSAYIQLSSSSELLGEKITLKPSGASGVFTGVVSTAIGPAVQDNKLQVSHGDKIEASYQDGDRVRKATVKADLLPPVIASVIATNQLGRIIVLWQTDEPAMGLVQYGTNSNLAFEASKSGLREVHEISIHDQLNPGVLYQYTVTAADPAGNVAIANNSGRYFTFVPTLAKTVLLVNAYTPSDPLFGTQEIPVTEYTEALDKTGVSYELWNISEKGSPDIDDLRPFRVVIWRLNDGFGTTDTLSPPQQSALQQYIDRGGSLFIASMELLSNLGASSFRTDVLQVAAFGEDSGIPKIEGMRSDPVTATMLMDLDYSYYESDLLESHQIGPDFSDTLTLTTNAVPIFFDASTGKSAGLRYPRTGEDGNGRVVFLSFPLEVVPMQGEEPNTRPNLLRNILSFLAPGVNGLGSIAMNNTEYTIPSLVTIEVADSDWAGFGESTAQIFSDTDPSGRTVVLTETVRKGLFRGSLTLVEPASPIVPGQLRVKHGDSIWAEYIDTSARGVVLATAVVDTKLPTITNIVSVPAYEDAVIRWETSEETDALVQFGESAFLGRTAYHAGPESLHKVRLTGLVPDRLYYYRIVSRDIAGNARTEDNNTKLYTFRTLKPLATPWADNFESSTVLTNWTVVSGEADPEFGDLSEGWKLGIPQNGTEQPAHSPIRAWGSNLNGEAINVSMSYLISPAVAIVGGNRATLRFWHSYDFSSRSELDLLELGRVYISSNNGNTWALLREFKDASLGWEEETIDLSGYTGKVVRIRFHYELKSFEPVPRPGWLIDDVSLNISSIVSGAVHITNNLAQASFSLAGPVTQSSQGFGVTLTNMPGGQYVITFAEVPYYLTPPPQTNSLTSSGAITFIGNYTFPDTNQNQISDLWEQQFFGGISTNRNGMVDTDKDGCSDLQEFLAGTDPNSRLSTLSLKSLIPLPNGSLRLTWASRNGRAYRVLGSNDATKWQPYSGYLWASGNETTYTLPALPTGQPYFFRIEVRP